MPTSISWTIATRRWIGTSLGLHWGGFMEKPSVKLLDPQYLDPTEGGSALFSVVRPTHVVPDISLKVLKHILDHLSNCSKHIHISPQYIFQHHHFTPPHFTLATVPSKKNRNEIINITMSPGFSWIFMDFHGFSWIFHYFPYPPLPKCSKHPRFKPLCFGTPSDPLRSTPMSQGVHGCLPMLWRHHESGRRLPGPETQEGPQRWQHALCGGRGHVQSELHLQGGRILRWGDEDHENHGETKEKLSI